MAASLRSAINAKCRECIYDPHSGMGNWRQQVSACSVTRRALWVVRPQSESVSASAAANRGRSGTQEAA